MIKVRRKVVVSFRYLSSATLNWWKCEFRHCSTWSFFLLSHTSMVVRECCKDDDASQWGKPEIRPRATPRPLNWSSPKVAHVITSWMPTDMQNWVPILQRGFFSAYARNCTSQMFTRLFSRVLPTPHSRGPRTDFHAKYIKRRSSAQGCAFCGLKTFST